MRVASVMMLEPEERKAPGEVRDARWILSARSVAPGAARYYVRKQLSEWSCPATVVDDAELVTSELVTAALRRSKVSRLVVSVMATTDEVRVTVEDGLLPTAELDGTALQIVTSLAHTSGEGMTASGGTLWCSFTGWATP